MKSHSISLKFKGARTYLHGSDIFNGLEDLFSRTEGLYLSKLRFKSFARSQIEVFIQRSFDDGRIIGQGLLKSASGAHVEFWLRETKSPVLESYDFDEDSLVMHANISGEQISLDMPNSYSTIENVIALTKKLNYVLTPNVSGKWLFGQIDLHSKLPKTWQGLRVVRAACVANKFSRNRLLIDGFEIGEIRFIGGTP